MVAERPNGTLGSAQRRWKESEMRKTAFHYMEALRASEKSHGWKKLSLADLAQLHVQSEPLPSLWYCTR